MIKPDQWVRVKGRRVAHYVDKTIVPSHFESVTPDITIEHVSVVLTDCGKRFEMNRVERVTITEENADDIPTCGMCDAHFVGRSGLK